MPRTDKAIAALALLLLVTAGIRWRSSLRTDPFRGAEFVPAWRQLVSAAPEPARREGEHEIVVFSDFACGACRAADSLLRSDAALSTRFRIRFRHIGLVGGDVSRRAAKLAHCATEPVAGFSAHAVFFSRTGGLGDAVIEVERRVDALAVSGPQVRACVASPATAEIVSRDESDASALALTGTPGILVDSMLFRGLPADLLARLRTLE